MTDIQKRLEKLRKAIPDLPPWPVDGFSFLGFRPDRPKGMHETTYRRHLVRFSRYQLRHGKRLMEDLARICR